MSSSQTCDRDVRMVSSCQTFHTDVRLFPWACHDSVHDLFLEVGHWVASEGRREDGNYVRERLCFLRTSSNVLEGPVFHLWYVNHSTDDVNWGEWPLVCKSRWP